MSENLTVGIVMGSASDTEIMKLAKDVLDEFGLANEMRILSAHRTPNEVVSWVKSCEQRGAKIIIAAAGMAAHLAGVVSAHANIPVFGVPLPGGLMTGLDSLLSTVQMPKGTPVATFAVGKAGAINAAIMAAKVLSLNDEDLKAKLAAYQEKVKAQALEADQKTE